MPVLQVFSTALDDARATLESLCSEVADALELEPTDVVAAYVPVADCVIPGEPEAQWPVVIIHGSRRETQRMSAAQQRVESVVSSWRGVNGAWVTWQVRG